MYTFVLCATLSKICLCKHLQFCFSKCCCYIEGRIVWYFFCRALDVSSHLEYCWLLMHIMHPSIVCRIPSFFVLPTSRSFKVSLISPLFQKPCKQFPDISCRFGPFYYTSFKLKRHVDAIFLQTHRISQDATAFNIFPRLNLS